MSTPKVYKVVGLSRRNGEYQGFKFDNINVHSTFSDPNVAGDGVSIIKIKSDIFETLDLSIGDSFIPYFDQYSHVIDVRKVDVKS